MDAQLSPRLAGQLSGKGYPAVHVIDHLPATARDDEIAEFANERGAVVVSKDEDFLELLNRGVLRTAFVWIRIGNTDSQRLWTVVESALPEIVRLLESGVRLVQVPVSR